MTLPPAGSRFPPGVSGNPGGGVKGYVRMSQAIEIVSMLDMKLIRALARGTWPKEFATCPDGRERSRCATYFLAARQIVKGIAKDHPGLNTTQAAEFLADRTEGKPTQRLVNDEEVRVHVIFEDALPARSDGPAAPPESEPDGP